MAIKEISRLPEGIVEIILFKLPIKSLIRFKTVSKSWNTMISNPRFVHTIIEECKNSRSHDNFLSILLYHPDTSSWVPKSGEFSFVKFENRRLETVKVVENPCGWTVYDVTICDGVVLLVGSRTEIFMLWNPSTRTHRVFELPYDGNGERFIPTNRGFCHDKRVGFKFVVVCLRDCYLVYTCKNSAWEVKQHEKLVEGAIKLWGFPGVSVDGGIYWINTHKTCHGGLVYFDPSDDKLKLLPKPENIDIGRYVDVFLVELKGRLCLYRTGKDKSTIHFWIKDKGIGNNVWKKLATIENTGELIYFFKPVCFVEGFKILIKRRDMDGKYVLYNLCENNFEDVKCENGLLRKQVVPYRGSLLFPTEETN